jgi:hypothetical protein
MLLAGAMVAQAVPAYADGTITMDTPYSAPYTNGCLPTDTFTAAGFLHTILHFNINSAGLLHFYSVDHTSDLKSVTPTLSGSTYVVSQTVNFIVDVTPSLNGVTDFGLPERLNVISLGPAPNFMHEVELRITFNQGAPKATIVENAFKCTV